MAQSFARKAVAAGHEVVLSNRSGPAALEDALAALGPSVSLATPEEAARNEIVLLAVPWLKAETTLRGLQDWNDQILIDATNSFGERGVIGYGDDSSSERIARIAAGARVVKAMNAIFMENFAQDPARDGLPARCSSPATTGPRTMRPRTCSKASASPPSFSGN